MNQSQTQTSIIANSNYNISKRLNYKVSETEVLNTILNSFSQIIIIIIIIMVNIYTGMSNLAKLL